MELKERLTTPHDASINTIQGVVSRQKHRRALSRSGIIGTGLDLINKTNFVSRLFVVHSEDWAFDSQDILSGIFHWKTVTGYP